MTTKTHSFKTISAATYGLVACALVTPISHAAANVLIALTLLLFFFEYPTYNIKAQIFKREPSLYLPLALYVFILLGIAYTDAPPSDWIGHITKYLKIGLIPIWSLILLNNPQAIVLCLYAIIATLLFIVASTWMNVWFILPWSVTKTPGWGVSHHVFGDYITQNVMVAFLVLWLLVHQDQHSKTIVSRLGWLAVAAAAGLSITHLSYGRTGVVLLCAALAIYFINAYRGKSLLVGAALIVSLIVAAVVTSDAMRARIAQAWTEAMHHQVDIQSSIGHRLYNYKITPRLIAQNPLLGGGTGSYHTSICQFVDPAVPCTTYNWHPHNQFLFFGAEHGIVGAALYLAMLFAFVRLGRRCRDFIPRVLLFGTTLLLATDSLFNSPLWSARESHFFTLTLGILIAYCLWSQKLDQSEPSTPTALHSHHDTI